MVPSGPEIRCSSSWMIRSGGGSGAARRVAAAGLRGAVEAGPIVPVGAAEEAAGLADPGEGGELVDGGDQESREPAVDRLVDGDDRQRAVAGEVALEVGADDAQLAGLVVVGQEREGLRLEARYRTRGSSRAGSARACSSDSP